MRALRTITITITITKNERPVASHLTTPRMRGSIRRPRDGNSDGKSDGRRVEDFNSNLFADLLYSFVRSNELIRFRANEFIRRSNSFGKRATKDTQQGARRAGEARVDASPNWLGDTLIFFYQWCRIQYVNPQNEQSPRQL